MAEPPFSIKQLEAAPEYASMNLDQQKKAREQYLSTYVAGQPEFQGLDQNTKVQVLSGILDRDPVFADPSSFDAQRALQKGAALDAGDPATQFDVAVEEGSRAAMRNTLVGTLMDQGSNALFGLLHPGETSDSIYGAEGQKASQYLLSRLARSPGVTPDLMQTLNVSTEIMGNLETLSEDVLLFTGGVGTLSKGGLLTKGLMGRVAEMTKGIDATTKGGKFLYGLASGFGEATVQGIVGGAISAAKTTVINGMQDGWGQESLANIAGQYGTDLATNYAMWVAFSTLGALGKTVGAVVRRPSMQRAEEAIRQRSPEQMTQDLASQLFKSGGQLPPDIMAQMPEEYRAAVLKAQEPLKAAYAAAKLQTPEDIATVFSTACGFSYKKKGPEYVVSSLGDDVERASFDTLDEVLHYASQNRNAPAPPPGGRLAASAARVQVRDEVKAPRVTDPQTLASLYSDTRPASMPDSREYVARQLFTESGARTEGLQFNKVPNNDLFGVGNEAYGIKSETALDPEVFRQQIAESIAQTGRVPIPTEAFASASQEAMYMDALRRGVIARGGSAELGDALEKALKPGSLGPLDSVSRSSKRALSSLAKTIYGPEARVVVLREGLAVTVPDASVRHADSLFGQAGRRTVLAEPGENSFRLGLLKDLRKAGNLSDDQISWIVTQSTGNRFERVTHKAADGSSTFDTFKMTSPSGEVVATFNNLEDALKEDWLLGRMIKLPDEYTPKAYVSDLGASKLTFENTLAEGRLLDVMDLAAQYSKPFTGLVAETRKVPIPGSETGAFYSKATREFTYTPYEGGVPIITSSLDKVKGFARAANNSLEAFKRDARARGCELVVGNDGISVIYDGNTSKAFGTRAELRKFFKDHPVPTDGPELVIPGALDAETLAKTEEEIRRVSADMGHFGPARQPGIANFLERSWQKLLHPEAAQEFIGPSASALSSISQRLGDEMPLRSYQRFKTGERLATAENRNYVRYVDEIWGGSSTDRRTRLGPLFSLPESQWAPVAKKLYNYELTAEDVTRLKKGTSFTNTFLRANGYDGLGDLYVRKSELQAAVQKALNAGEELPSDAPTFIRQALGKDAPRSLSLFADGLTRTDLLNFFEEKDPAVAMMSIIDKVHRQRFLAPMQPELARTVAALSKAVNEGSAPRSALKFFSDTLDESQGIKTSAQIRINETARRVSYSLANQVNKVGALRRFGLGEEIKTDDLLGKLGQLFTNNSQAFRAWAIPRNMTQIMYIGAVTGSRKMWKSLDYVLEHPEYVDSLYKRGSMQESILSMGGEALTPLQKLNKAGLAPLEVSDGLTRATAMRAAESSFDEALPRFKKGLSDSHQFLKECNATFLEVPEQKIFLDLMTKDTNAARDYLGQHMQLVTMFDYSRGSLGYTTRYAIGRLFGKMGTYPMSAVDLYRRTLATGDPSERLARAARLVGFSYAVYYAFQAAGASYDGFLWSDPFSFSGGPYWTILTNALNAVGDRPENKLARSSLKRQMLSATVPGAMLASYAGRAVEAVDSGDPVALMKALATVPLSQEERLRRQQGY